jgi:hypothetical protein
MDTYGEFEPKSYRLIGMISPFCFALYAEIPYPKEF